MRTGRPPRGVTAEDRFWARVDPKPNDCWLWMGSASFGGYGGLVVNGRVRLAHVFSYELAYGPLDAGQEVHHECEAPLCVNPDHLIAVTRRQHGILHGRSGYGDRCMRGHEFTSTNTAFRKNGTRRCKTCSAERMRARRIKVAA